MFELGVSDYKNMIKETNKANFLGSKPLILFNGEHFENNQDLKIIENYFIDFFQGERPNKVNVEGIDHCIVFTSLSDTKFRFDHYYIEQKMGAKAPSINLEFIGPSMVNIILKLVI
jgi:ribosome production factor 2